MIKRLKFENDKFKFKEGKTLVDDKFALFLS